MMNENYNADHGLRVTGHGDEINLLDYWHVILRHKKMIVAIVIAASIAAVIVSFVLPKKYKAEAVLIPITSKGSGGLSNIASQFGGLASLAGMSLPGGSPESDKFMAILTSRTLAENVINRENLMPILFEKKWDKKNEKWKSNSVDKKPTMEAAVIRMKGMIVILDDKKAKTIKISGKFETPELAARVVNAYVDELQQFINKNSFTMAKRNRIFIEGQLAQNKEELLEAGKEINEFYRGNRVSSSESKMDVPIEVGQGTGNQELVVGPGTGNLEPGKTIAMLDVPGSGSQVPGPDQADASTVIQSLIAQKSDVDKKIADARTVKNVPQQVYLTYLMLRRELLVKMNALLTSQYEMAKIDESKEDLAFQVIDKAVPPVLRASPKRGQICIMSFMAALFGAIFLAFFREYLKRMKTLHQAQSMP